MHTRSVFTVQRSSMRLSLVRASALNPPHRAALEEEEARLGRTLRAMGPRLPDGGARIRARLDAIDEQLHALEAQQATHHAPTAREVVDLCESDDAAAPAPAPPQEGGAEANAVDAVDGSGGGASGASVTVYDEGGSAHEVPVPSHDLTAEALAAVVCDRHGRMVASLADADGWHDHVRDLAELELDYKHWKRCAVVDDCG